MDLEDPAEQEVEYAFYEVKDSFEDVTDEIEHVHQTPSVVPDNTQGVLFCRIPHLTGHSTALLTQI